MKLMPTRLIGPCLLAGLTWFTLGLSACGGGGASSAAPAATAPDVLITGTLVARIYSLVSTFAGGEQPGDLDSKATPASFNQPLFVVADAGGNLYVADTNNHKIRKIIPSGQVSTLAGSGTSGHADGSQGTAASFNHPRGLAVDKDGNVYVADYDNHLIRKVTSSGEVSTVAGSSGASGSVDGTGSAARFTRPEGIAVDNSGTLYVADTFSHKIRKITPTGVVTTVAGSGVPGGTDGTGFVASFNAPTGITVDPAGSTLYVGDSGSHTVRRVVLATGEVSTLAGSGSAGANDAQGAAASFNHPEGVALDASATTLYVADYGNHKIRKIELATQVVTTVAGSGSDSDVDGTGTAATFSFPFGLTVGPGGLIHVADSGNDKVRRITPEGVVTTWAGSGTAGAEDTAAAFNELGHVAIDASGNLYVTDPMNHKVRKVTAAGEVSTWAGSGDEGLVKGASTTASFEMPYGIAVDGQGNVYVSDMSAMEIRKVTPNGTVSTLAGSGLRGDADGAAMAASFDQPAGLALDARGTTLYVADFGNHKVRQIDLATGAVSTLVASSVAHPIVNPAALATDANGDVYVAEYRGHRIRKITSTGVVSVVAGSGTDGQLDGVGELALLGYPTGLVLGGDGNLYVTQLQGGGLVRKVTKAGVVSTLATGRSDERGIVDGPLDQASFSNYSLAGIAMDAIGRLYVANGSMIRRIE